MMVNSDCKISGQFYVLLLVVPNRYNIRIIEQNISCHQSWIGKKTSTYRFFSLALGLKLRHSEKLSCVSTASQYPAKFCMSGNLGLNEND